jgi:hypothetical protein
LKERSSVMKRVVTITLLIIMLTMAALAGGGYLVAREYIDPTLNQLDRAVASLEPESGKDVMMPLQNLQRLRRMGDTYVPAVLLLTGIISGFVLSLCLRGSVKGVAAIDQDATGLAEEEVTAEGEEPTGEAEIDPAEVGACRILSLLQSKGRLIDFLQENIRDYQDAQIGAAVRTIHEDCSKALSEHITFAPIVDEQEGETVKISKGFDPSEIRLTGNISGAPPFEGIIQHPGWKITQITLPGQPTGQKHTVIAPAEVEIGEETR